MQPKMYKLLLKYEKIHLKYNNLSITFIIYINIKTNLLTLTLQI